MTDMRKIKWVLAGMFVSMLLVVLVGVLFLREENAVSPRAKPSAVETWMARTARSIAIPATVKQLQNPVAKTPEVIAEGMAHWADHCAVCHSNNGDGQAAMGKGMYPPAPDMRQAATQQMTDGELFYVIENGVRLTGMPAWGGGAHNSSEASWKLVHFIRHLPELTFAEKREMEHLNPKGPAEFEEEKLNEEFLNGDDSHDQAK